MNTGDQSAEQIKDVAETAQEITGQELQSSGTGEEAASGSNEGAGEEGQAAAEVTQVEAPAETKEEVKEEIPPAEVVEVKELPKLEEVQPVAPPPEKKEEKKSAKNDRLKYLDNITDNGTEVQKRILTSLQAFEQGLRPRTPIADTAGAKLQYEFLSAIVWLLRKEYNDFRDGWNTVLIFFAEYHGDTNTHANYSALSEYSTGRFLAAWSKGGESCAAYVRLIALIRATRHKDSRKEEMKSIDLSKIAPTIFTDEMLNNLKNFYKV